MVKKRVEEKNEGGVMLDESALDMTLKPVPQVTPSQEEQEEEQEAPVQGFQGTDGTGLINPLRNERIIIRFIPKPSALVQNPKHVLYGGMAETAVRNFVVPRLTSTGTYKNILTNSEKAYLEYAMGLAPNALSIHKKHDNFWDDSNPEGIGRVTLHKEDNFLNLNIPEEYIKYKILLANSDTIAPSMQALQEHPKATYQFVIISEGAESSANLSRMDVTMKCYTEYGAVRNDVDTLRVVIELLEGRPLGVKTKLDFLQSKVNDYIQKDPRMFLATITDEYLPYKVLIRKSIEAGLISKKNDAYYLRQDGTPLCEMGEDSTLNNAAKYLASIKRQELKYMLEAKLKQQ